jgi:hypothetical protein
MPKNAFVIHIPKPRARQLHEVLLGAKGGRMRSPKDYNRQNLKRDLQRQLNDNS